MRSVVNKAYAQILRDGEIGLFKSYRKDYKDGAQDRDFVHVDDAVAVTLFFLDHANVTGLYNCGTGVARTWIDLAHALFAAMEAAPRIRFIDMPKGIREKYQYHTCAQTAKLRAAGFAAPFLSIEDGVRRYVREYLQAQPMG
jgi:ADP-L-glycero-D-manno-heptose 6-epimerase